MKNFITRTFIIFSLLAFCFYLPYKFDEVQAQKAGKAAGKQSAQSAVNEGIASVNQMIAYLTKKIYSAGLFSPKDTNRLFELKDKLYNLISKNPTNRELAKPFFDTALIFKEREMYEESAELLNIVIERFPPGGGGEDAEASGEGEGDGSTPSFSIDYSSKAQKVLEKIKKEHPLD